MSDTKIYISCHRPDFFVPESGCFTPVQVGAALCDARFPGMVPDDTGDNISALNRSFCELTAQYWVWKNEVHDYYGFFHYRRYISFAEDFPDVPDDFNVIRRDFLDSDAVAELGLADADAVGRYVSDYDVITIHPADLSKAGKPSVREQYRIDGTRLHVEDLDLMLQIIDDMHPDFSDVARRYLDGTTAYTGNIFIMSGRFFAPYCEWLFSILFEFVKRRDMSSYSVEGYRTPGHLAERLFGIYYTHLKEEGTARLRELPMVFFSDSTRHDPISPAFEGPEVPIIMSSSDFYAPYCGATIKSLLDHTDLRTRYDILLLENGMSQKNQGLLMKMTAPYANVSLRFLDARYFIRNYRLYESPTISVETYFRFIIPDICACFKKVLYLDSDLIVRADVADLFEEDLGDCLVAGVADVAAAGDVNGFKPENAEYFHTKLRMTDPSRYFNAGVLIINNEALRREYTTARLFEFAQESAFRFQDQDALNVICKGRVKWLDQAWNFAADQQDWYRGQAEAFAPHDLYLAYRAAAKDPKILHYMGNEKPWRYPDQEWADEFWTVFQETPFFGPWLATRTGEVVSGAGAPAPQDDAGGFRRLARRMFPADTGRGRALRALRGRMKGEADR